MHTRAERREKLAQIKKKLWDRVYAWTFLYFVKYIGEREEKAKEFYLDQLPNEGKSRHSKRNCRLCTKHPSRKYLMEKVKTKEELKNIDDCMEED